MTHDAAALLDANALFRVDEVQRNAHGQFLVFRDAQKIHVHDDRTEWMSLHVLDDDLLGTGVQVQRQYVGEKGLLDDFN